MRANGQHSMKMSSHGFTLVEILVGLTILSLSLGVLYQSFGWSMQRSGQLAKKELAWLTAQSMLAEIALDPASRQGIDTGHTGIGGMEWKTDVRRRPTESGERLSIKPFEVSVTISWGEGRSQRVLLESIELGRENPV